VRPSRLIENEAGVVVDTQFYAEPQAVAKPEGSDAMTRIQSVWASGARTILLFAALGASVPAYAQTETEPRLWTAVSVQGRMGSNSPWRWAADSLMRTRNGAGTMDFVAEWFTVSRDVTRRTSVGIGYAYGAGFPESGPVREHRFVQQYTWSSGIARSVVSFRTRVEERFLSGHDAMLIRMRQQVRVTWPLAGKSLRGVVSGEVCFRTNSTVRAARGFDSSRVFVGIGSKVTERNRIEVGYVNVYSPGARSRKPYSHVLSATLVVSM
jgi:hypothetical protein